MEIIKFAYAIFGTKPSNNNTTANTVTPQGNKVASYQNNDFYQSGDGTMRCYDANGNMVKNNFKCDGTYTYYFQNDGTAMTDRLTYHPDGEHVIYFDENGQPEVFQLPENTPANPYDLES